MPVTKTRVAEDQLNKTFNFDDVSTAISKSHDQNTDVGTSSNTFYIGTSGPKIKNNANVVELRNSTDTAYADLKVNDLTVYGTSTTVSFETLTIEDNMIILNSNYEGSMPTDNASIEIERGTLTNASLIWDETNDLWKAGLAGSEKTIVMQNNTVTITNGVTGSASFDASGNVSISATVDSSKHVHTFTSLSDVRTGRATIINKGVISGCTATKAIDITRTVIIGSGSAFAEGMIFPIIQTNVTVPENAFTSSKYCYIYLSKTGTQWNPVCTALDATVPTDGVPLYRLTVPANNTIVTDQYIANVTVTDNRRLEPNAPNAFSNSPFVLTSLSPVVANTNYIVNYDIASYTGSALQLGDIYIADKATNGFKIYLNGIADNVVINWAINGFNV